MTLEQFYTRWKRLYPGKPLPSDDTPLTYEELRAMGYEQAAIYSGKVDKEFRARRDPRWTK